MMSLVVSVVAAVSAATFAWYQAFTPAARRPVRTPTVAAVVGAGPPASRVSLLVRVLGPVTVERDGEPLVLTPRMVELVAYLATHAHGVAEDQLRCALWPERSPSPASLRNLLWQARQRLGDIEGEPALATIDGHGRYRLHARVACDLTLLDDATDDPQRAAAVLTLVRGRPFAARRRFEWAYADGLVAFAERRVTAAAERVATHALTRRDVPAAITAVELALRAAPTDERLFRILMEAHAAEGDTAAVEGVMRRLMASLEVDDLGELEPETRAVFRECGRGDELRRRR